MLLFNKNVTKNKAVFSTAALFVVDPGSVFPFL